MSTVTAIFSLAIDFKKKFIFGTNVGSERLHSTFVLFLVLCQILALFAVESQRQRFQQDEHSSFISRLSKNHDYSLKSILLQTVPEFEADKLQSHEAWKIVLSSHGRNGFAVTKLSNLILIAGGWDGTTIFYDQVDIFNVLDGTWTTAILSQARSSLAATSVDNRYALFGGGYNGSGPSNVVDIFDSLSGMWNTTALSQARSDLAATSLGKLAFFGGGLTNGKQPSNVVDIFNSTSQTWSTSTLSQARHGLVASSIGEIVAFGGGWDDSGPSSVVDMLNVTSNTWFTVNLSQPFDDFLFSLLLTNKIAINRLVDRKRTLHNVAEIMQTPSTPSPSPSSNQIESSAVAAIVISVIAGVIIIVVVILIILYFLRRRARQNSSQPVSTPQSDPHLNSTPQRDNLSNPTPIKTTSPSNPTPQRDNIFNPTTPNISNNPSNPTPQRDNLSNPTFQNDNKFAFLPPNSNQPILSNPQVDRPFVSNQQFQTPNFMTQGTGSNPVLGVGVNTNVNVSPVKETFVSSPQNKPPEVTTPQSQPYVRPDRQSYLSFQIPFEELRIGNPIGAGYYGKVHLGVWKEQLVAVKCCIPNSEMPIELQKKEFLNEAQILAELPPHPNVVKFIGISFAPQFEVIVLEYCEGGSLDKILYNYDWPITTDQKMRWIRGIAAGMLHLHKHNVIHRDLAARNILLTQDGVSKISDFGMSRVLELTLEGRTKSPFGAFCWMAPESLQRGPGQKVYSKKSDAWMFGCVVYEIVARKEPHAERAQKEPFKVLEDIRDKKITPGIPVDCPLKLQRLMRMCWAPNPDQRPTFEEICRMLEE